VISAPVSFDFAVAPDHPSLPGHFPSHPVVPGVLILEAVACRAAALLGPPWRLRRLPQVKFVAPLLPGENAQIELLPDPTAGRVRFRVAREAESLASGELVFASE
jgi:3-hydroxymyristoyl/3-hydroxydecanoyl-(acyl carrier protein) dehydratase